MRKIILFLAVLGLSGSLWAADPIIGTWKLNVAKSTYEPDLQHTVKEQTNVIKELNGDLYELTSETLVSNDKGNMVLISKVTFPKKGGMEVVQQSATREPFIVVTMIAPGNWCFTHLHKGKQTWVSHLVVSKDGLTAQENTRGLHQGEPFERLLFFEKQ